MEMGKIKWIKMRNICQILAAAAFSGMAVKISLAVNPAWNFFETYEW